ncbi:MAG TPA: tetratricopeptide repeat protein [Anaeromyxobacteraceae bacterium]|nr:tetratricopeptide repeat protein [Anaeromyxobacteraceae bacterium]
MGERYLYLPSAGLALLAALAWSEWRQRDPARDRLRLVTAAVLVAAGAAATVARNRAWHDDLALWTDAAQKAPRSAAAHEHLGYALIAAGRPAEAILSLSRALEIDPGRRDARTNLASALAAGGRLDEAIAQVQGVLAERPQKPEAHAILASALASQGKLTEAVAEYRRAVELDPRVASFHNGLAIALALLGEVRQAEEHFREAMRLDPGEPRYAENLIILQRRACWGPPGPAKR